MKTKNKILIIIGVILLGFSVMLTFFILSTTLSKPVTMQLSLPDKTDIDTTQVKLKDTIEIIVMDNSKVYFESNADRQKGIAAINSADLKNFLEKQRKIIGKNKCTIILTANEDGRYKDMVETLDLFAVLEFKRYVMQKASEKDLAKVSDYKLEHENQ
jgi:biopolymer transport protein ExbD